MTRSEKTSSAEAINLTKEDLLGFITANPAVLYALKIEGEQFKPIWVSDNIARVLGYAPRECIGNPDWWISNVHEDDRAGAFARMPSLMVDGYLVHEYRFRHGAGHYFWVRDEVRISRGEPGAVSELSGAWMDISARRDVEARLEESLISLEERVSVRTAELEHANEQFEHELAERRKTEEALQKSEEQLRLAVTNAPIPVYMHAEDGEVLLTSRQWVEASGYSLDDIPTIADWVEKAYGGNEKNRQLQTKVIESLYDATRVAEHETEITTASGEKRLWHFRDAPLGRLKDGRRFVISMVNDITEQRKAEEQLRRAQKMEAVGQLAGGVAHDFNNLLGVILGNAEVLRPLINDNEKARQLVDGVASAVERGKSLTQRLLSFSRQQLLTPAATDVDGLVRGLEDMLRRTLGEMIELRIAPGDGVWSATLDAHQFENALLNLAINARDAMPKGGTLEIATGNVTLDEVDAGRPDDVAPGGYVQVMVRDSGTGIAAEAIDRVFEPFFTTKGVGVGSGLGLSMVYGFAKQSGGLVTIDSEIGRGTTVALYLPRAHNDATRDDEEDLVPAALAVPPRKARVLVVEDDDMLRKIPVSILRDRGFEVVEARNGAEALEHLRNAKPFDLLFSDIVLPGGMNGVETAQSARHLQSDIKVLFTTGYAQNAVAELAADGTRILRKPYGRIQLLGEIEAMLNDDSAHRRVA